MGSMPKAGSANTSAFFRRWASKHQDEVKLVRAMMDDVEKEQEAERAASFEIAAMHRKLSEQRNARRAKSGGLQAKIPGFWLEAMQNVEAINREMLPGDARLLKDLVDIRVEHLTPEEAEAVCPGCVQGHRIIFTFSPNDFISDEMLTKTMGFKMVEGLNNIVLEVAMGCKIHWKEGKNITREVVDIGEASFFHFFATTDKAETERFLNQMGPYVWDKEEAEAEAKAEATTAGASCLSTSSGSNCGKNPAAEDVDSNILDPYGYDRWRNVIVHEDVSDAFVHRLVPFAVHFYTGEAMTFPSYEGFCIREEEEEEEEDETE